VNEIKEGHSRQDYEACLEYAKKNDYRAMYNAMAEDGYDQNVNWRKLMQEGEEG
jgi:hypothetical protein